MLNVDDMQIYQSFLLEQIDAGIAHMQLNAQAVADWASENEPTNKNKLYTPPLCRDY